MLQCKRVSFLSGAYGPLTMHLEGVEGRLFFSSKVLWASDSVFDGSEGKTVCPFTYRLVKVRLEGVLGTQTNMCEKTHTTHLGTNNECILEKHKVIC